MDDIVERLNAALEGRYEIEREIGEGGMATVYLAKDVKHNRNVAVKVLKPELAAVVGADRFLAEIETTANLQHPHILPLFDSGEADGFLFYVMPFIDGETLRDRLDREKQLPVEEAIGIATAVANALQTAHEAGVVHRDIKPGNILMSQGEPLVSDFGIALAVGAAGGNRLTETGLSVGTPYYRSPEQATGDTAMGPPSDVYALACVLYEMLVGEPPYTGNTAQAVLGKIIMGEPVSATAIRSSIPANVDAAIRRSLEKLPADRFTSAQGFAKALGEPGFRHGVESGGWTASSGRAGAWTPLTGALALIALVAVAGVLWMLTRSETPDPVVRTRLDLGDLTLNFIDQVVVSDDGDRFALAGSRDGQQALYVRNADEEQFRLVQGTEDARHPAFSPEGDWIAYVATDEGAVMRVSVAGGAPRVVAPGDLDPAFLDWGDDGNMVFLGEGQDGEGLYRVPETGGEPELLLAGQWLNPRMLTGGRALLATNNDDLSTYFLSLGADSARLLIPDGADATYVETGHLLYADASGGLWAVGFDPGEGVLEGEPTPVLSGVTTRFGRFAQFAVAANGTLVYGAGGVGGLVGGRQQLLVTDLQGNEDVRPLEPREFRRFRWSPDGASVVFFGDPNPEINIYTYNVELGTTPKQLTFEGLNVEPVWSPDGSRVAFASQRDGTDEMDLFVKTVDDDAPPELILTRPGVQLVVHWPAEDVLVFEDGNPSDLWIVDPSDSTSARAYLTSEAELEDMAISPDGTLAAYTSDETGVEEVYVRSFPAPLQPVKVSDGGGDYPRWSPDGDVLYYWRSAPEDTLFATSVQRDPTFSVLRREVLFARTYAQAGWDLHPDGDRMAVPRVLGAAGSAGEDEAEAERHLVVTNWFAELRAALGEGN